jgi:hypothetical protein
MARRSFVPDPLGVPHKVVEVVQDGQISAAETVGAA